MASAKSSLASTLPMLWILHTVSPITERMSCPHLDKAQMLFHSRLRAQLAKCMTAMA
jgi:hypothetical protein